MKVIILGDGLLEKELKNQTSSDSVSRASHQIDFNDEKNQYIHKKYKELAGFHQNIIFGGRSAEYKYYDMH